MSSSIRCSDMFLSDLDTLLSVRNSTKIIDRFTRDFSKILKSYMISNWFSSS